MENEVVILDVRTPGEYELGHLRGSVLLDWNSGEFAAEFGRLDPATTYLLYCRSGNRSGQAAALMKRRGYRSAKNIGSLQEAAAVTGHDIVTT